MKTHRTDRHRRRLLELFAVAGASALAGCGSVAPGGPRIAGQETVTTQEAGETGLPDELAREVVLRALSLVDTPYRRGGNTPESGFDCSGLIAFVFRDAAGIVLPRTVAEMASLGRPVTRGSVRSADLVFFDAAGPLSHAGIYVGDGKFAHAPSTGGRVRLDRIQTRFWAPRLSVIRRV